MQALPRKLMLQIAGIVVFFGVVLFLAVNTAEAKTLYGYVMTLLKPFIYGFVTAFILNLVTKVVDKGFAKHAQKKGRTYDVKKHRKLSIIISMLVFVAFAGLTIGLIIPNLKDTFLSLYSQAPALWDKVLGFLDGIAEKHPKTASLITSAENGLDSYFSKLTVTLKNNLSNILSGALTKVKGASNVLVNFALGLVIAFVILWQKEELTREFFAILRKILPQKIYPKAVYILKLTNEKFQIYFKYNLIQALITGAGTLLMMFIAGMPYKFSIALLITVTQLIPIVGAIIGTGVSALLIAAVSPIKAIIFIILSIVVQQIVEKLINPHLMGKELEMPGILTFLAIVIGGKQFGLPGLICSVPLVSLVYDLYTQNLRPKILDKTKEDNEK